MKKTTTLLLALTGAMSLPLQAQNLLQVYQDALCSSPEIGQAAAMRDAAYAGIAGARSALLPQLGLSAGVNHYTYKYKDSYTLQEKVQSASVALSQVLFDMSKWRALDVQQKNAALQDIALQTARQKMMLNVASGYFSALSAADALTYVTAQKKALATRLEQTRESYDSGLSTITDVQSVRAQYDNFQATVVQARNNLDNALDQLHQLTGRRYARLAGLDLRKFRPSRAENTGSLVENAQSHNLSLLQARLGKELSGEQIRQAEAGHLPVLNFTASKGLSGSRYNSQYTDNDAANETIGLTLTMPLYSGGAISAQVDQAQANYVAATEQLESTFRSINTAIHSAVNAVNASVSTISADEQAEVSSGAALHSTEEGYQAGTRTIVDVLDATSALFNVRQQLSVARYSWIINQLNIKSVEGDLKEKDFQHMNALLGNDINVSEKG